MADSPFDNNATDQQRQPLLSQQPSDEIHDDATQSPTEPVLIVNASTSYPATDISDEKQPLFDQPSSDDINEGANTPQPETQPLLQLQQHLSDNAAQVNFAVSSSDSNTKLSPPTSDPIYSAASIKNKRKKKIQESTDSVEGNVNDEMTPQLESKINSVNINTGMDDDVTSKLSVSAMSSEADLDEIDFSDIKLPELDSMASERVRNEIISLRQQMASSIATDESEMHLGEGYDGLGIDPQLDEETVFVESLDLNEVRNKEKDETAKLVQQRLEMQKDYERRAQLLIIRQEQAKSELEAASREVNKQLKKKKADLTSGETSHMKHQTIAFRKTEEASKRVLESQKKVIKDSYGELQESHPLNPDGSKRDFNRKHFWYKQYPRLMRVKVHHLRAMKNKVPAGQFVVMVTLYDRLGGHPIRWSKMPDKSGYRHTASTLTPALHSGKFYSVDLSFGSDKNDMILCIPPRVYTQPSNVLIFELFAVRGGKHKFDHVVGWGAFPMCYPNLHMIQGKYKVPLLRGEMNRDIDKFDQLEERISKNIDYWLCNLYFETVQVPVKPTYVWGGWKINKLEYRVNFDKEDPLSLQNGLQVGKRPLQISSQPSFFRRTSAVNLNDNPVAEKGSLEGEPGVDGDSTDNTRPNSLMPTPTASISNIKLGTISNINSSSSLQQNTKFRRIAAAGLLGDLEGQNSTIVDELYNEVLEEEMNRKKKRTRFFGQQQEETEEEGDGEPSAEESELQKKNAMRAKAKELRRFKFSITDVEGDIPVNQYTEKLRFLFNEILSDVGRNRWSTLEFWSTLLFFVFTFWIRMYFHYLGQYATLQQLNIPIYNFQPSAYIITLSYQTDPSDPALFVTEGVIVCMGVLSNILIFIGMIIVAKFIQAVLGWIPDMISRFLLCYGLQVVLDPFWILLVDLCIQNWHGDCFKLYWAGMYLDQSGASGILLTIVLEMLLVNISGLIYYIYAVRVHMNGRMLDIHHRLHGEENSFFIPHDMEISMRTLKHIIKKSKKWKGFHGTSRKIMVTSYVIQDHLDPTFIDRTVHISLYNVTPKTAKRPETREIFRHFLRKNDGTILEAFDTEESEADGYRKMEDRWLSQESGSMLDKMAEDEIIMLQAMENKAKKDMDVQAIRGLTAKDAFGQGIRRLKTLAGIRGSADVPPTGLGTESPRPLFLTDKKPDFPLGGIHEGSEEEEDSKSHSNTARVDYDARMDAAAAPGLLLENENENEQEEDV